MLTMTRIVLTLATFALISAASAQQNNPPFTVDDLVRLKRVSDPQASPDGRYIAFVLRETDMEANKGRTDLWLLDLEQRDAAPRQLTHDEANDSSPRWAPDGRTLYFLSSRSGSSQVWRLRLDGGEASPVTDYPLDVGTLKVSPTGEHIAITMEVLPDCKDLACTTNTLEQREQSPETGRIYDELFVRHWDVWQNGTRSHLFTASLGEDGKAGSPVAVSRPLDGDVPSKPFGGDEEFTFSPDGQRVVFSMRTAGRTEPWSTNFDLFEAPADGSSPPKNLTEDNPAWDTQPVFLANGDLAYLAMEHPGYESDRFRIILRDGRTGAKRVLTDAWDRSVGHLATTADRKGLLATANDLGQTALFSIDVNGGTPRKIVGTGQVAEIAPIRGAVVFSWANLADPADLYVTSLRGGSTRRLTDANRRLLAERALGEFEQYSFSGWNGETVYGYVVKPYGFQPGGRYPIAFVVHGGPQGSFQNLWNYRWNAQAFAGRGYAVVMVDFHGSTGYGQAFTDSINRDWGGKPLEDLRKGLSAALEKYPWLDGDRACALGASYGGYMMNWIAGQWSDGFRCLVNHAGVFDTRSMYYSTEELWFPEWDMGGPYYENPEAHEKFNPASYVKQWQTPMLVSHGQMDYRVPYTQGLSAFTVLQRRGIDSRFLIFPDENHWVLKPANSVQWYTTALDWLDRYLGK